MTILICGAIQPYPFLERSHAEGKIGYIRLL